MTQKQSQLTSTHIQSFSLTPTSWRYLIWDYLLCCSQQHTFYEDQLHQTGHDAHCIFRLVESSSLEYVRQEKGNFFVILNKKIPKPNFLHKHLTTGLPLNTCLVLLVDACDRGDWKAFVISTAQTNKKLSSDSILLQYCFWSWSMSIIDIYNDNKERNYCAFTQKLISYFLNVSLFKKVWLLCAFRRQSTKKNFKMESEKHFLIQRLIQDELSEI